MVRLMMDRLSAEEITWGFPSPLYVSCWADDTKVTEYLLEKLPSDKIQEPGPDGLTALMILIKRNKISVIEKNMDKFNTEELQRLSIAFHKLELFRKIHTTSEDWIPWLLLAIKANNLQWVEYIRAERGHQLIVSIAAQLAFQTPFIDMRIEIGLPRDQRESYLINITRKYPVYNEESEEKMKFTELTEPSKVSVKDDILVHLRDQFCCLSVPDGEEEKHVFQMQNLRLYTNFNCPEERHGG